MGIFPVDAQGLIHLQVLAGLDASSAQDALIRIVTVKGIGDVLFIRLGFEGGFLVLDA